jgi:hypothetical protein
LTNELKSDLEREARLRKMSVSTVLDLAVREWLKKSALDIAGDEVEISGPAYFCLAEWHSESARRLFKS